MPPPLKSTPATSFTLSAEASAKLANVSIPAATNTSAAIGPIPSIFFKSSPFFEVYFLPYALSAIQLKVIILSLYRKDCK